VTFTIALKDAACELIKKMPENSSLEDIMYEINLLAQVLDGLNDAEEGRVISTEELLRRVDEWAT
jgi:predicted transcriptional regulator